MSQLLCPSMMCADLQNLQHEVHQLDQAGVDIFHCDIMDGSFVPNFALGLSDVQAIRKSTDALVDVHLMIEDPADKIDWFLDAGADLIYIHPESERYVVKTLAHIKDRGKMAGIAINPDTSIETIKEMIYLCDYVLVMTVNPGFAGQKFQKFTIHKINKLVEMKKEFGFKIVVDGACSPEVILHLLKMGVDGFVLGTSALFGKPGTYQQIVASLRKTMQELPNEK
ncbi:MAG: ribulose-phosphate 3-epimerase [Absicoccus sp.]|uniref:ribulose-phosphate 3-epimerase n=1 Tax=Absicoccus sp. TaxID=2718527 RepID=UPI002A7487F4|nr:ribulose-phosphate 3-epimerase [Absicoccus sp.]MDY3035431.1 ribulose-phosphate 3-epimerase [Absicoccus sp.]